MTISEEGTVNPETPEQAMQRLADDDAFFNPAPVRAASSSLDRADALYDRLIQMRVGPLRNIVAFEELAEDAIDALFALSQPPVADLDGLREARETIAFLRSVIRSGERLDVHDEARIDATLARLTAIPALDTEKDHPEAMCQRCGRPNVRSWHAPSPLWNAVLRDPKTGEDRWSIVCPPCFAELAEAAGIVNETWHFGPHSDVSDLWSDASGRTWDPTRCLWVEHAPGIACPVEL